jgi:fatty acid synthase subunit alpha
MTYVNCASSATALQSLEIASDTILSGKAKVMIAGGFDDISEEGSYEFANMKATSNAETEFAMGREPTEMSRPATTSRAGFMESQGTGVHIVMSAKTALELGAPIRGILAFTSTSTYVFSSAVYYAALTNSSYIATKLDVQFLHQDVVP